MTMLRIYYFRSIALEEHIFQKKVMPYKLAQRQRMPTKKQGERKKMLLVSFKVPKLFVRKPEICL